MYLKPASTASTVSPRLSIETPAPSEPVSNRLTLSARRSVVFSGLLPELLAEVLLGTLGVGDAESGRHLVVHLPVAVGAARAELVRRRHPPDRAAVGVLAVELARLDAQDAVVVRERRVVPEPRQRLADRVDTGAEIGPEELVRHHPIVPQPVTDASPVSDREPGLPVRPSVEAELLAELVADVGEDGVLVGRIHRPERDRVDQLRIHHPPLEEDHDAVGVDVVPADRPAVRCPDGR